MPACRRASRRRSATWRSCWRGCSVEAFAVGVRIAAPLLLVSLLMYPRHGRAQPPDADLPGVLHRPAAADPGRLRDPHAVVRRPGCWPSSACSRTRWRSSCRAAERRWPTSRTTAQKTEEPSQRRLEEARRKGQVASSREVNHALILGAGRAAGRRRSRRRSPATWRRRCARCSSGPHAFALDARPTSTGCSPALLGELGVALLPAALLLVGAALAGGLIQNGPSLSAAAARPQARADLAARRRQAPVLAALAGRVRQGRGQDRPGGAAAGVALLWPAARDHRRGRRAGGRRAAGRAARPGAAPAGRASRCWSG